MYFWLQVYEPGSSGHDIHDHWSGNEMFSWVHFLKPVNKSFHFLVEGQKVYPKRQNPGDFIVFPSWALHAVDGNDTDDERVVIAGNVMMDSFNVDYNNGHVKYTTDAPQLQRMFMFGMLLIGDNRRKFVKLCLY